MARRASKTFVSYTFTAYGKNGNGWVAAYPAIRTEEGIEAVLSLIRQRVAERTGFSPDEVQPCIVFMRDLEG